MSKNFVDNDNATALMGSVANKINYEFFDGTEEEFEALPLSEKIKYTYTIFDNDYKFVDPTTQVVDVVEAGNLNPVTSNAVSDALDDKQGVLTFDNSPMAGSNNPVKSSGIKTALDGKADNATTLAGYNISNAYTKDEVDNKISELVTSMTWKPAVATFSDIATTYPNPREGWTVVTTDTNIAWRYTNGAWIEISANTIPVVTSSVNGLMTSAMLGKLDGIATGAEVNQNTFSNVKVGTATIGADSKTDTLELVAGSNVTLTPDTTNDKITIASTNTWRGIQNNLTSTSTTDSLSAYQGKLLNDKFGSYLTAYRFPNDSGLTCIQMADWKFITGTNTVTATINEPYGSMYWGRASITIPNSFGSIGGIWACNITLYGGGLTTCKVDNINGRTVNLFLFDTIARASEDYILLIEMIVYA